MRENPAAATIDRRFAELTIVNALRRIMRTIRLSAAAIQSQSGVSAAQLYVLQQLAQDRKGTSIGDLADRTLTDRSSVASAVDRLVGMGLAHRTKSTSDRRRSEVRITPAGEDLVLTSVPPPTYQLVSALETLADSDLVDLARSLTSLVEAMGIGETPASMFFDDTNDR